MTTVTHPSADTEPSVDPNEPESTESSNNGRLQRLLKLEITRKKIPLRELQQFSRQVAVFVRAGIPLTEALEMVRDETANKLFRTVLEDIVSALHNGSTLADAAAAHSTVFPPYYLGILRAAELTGNLDTVLVQLSDYIERDLDARRKIVGALIYPGVIAGMAVIVVGVLVGYVLPRFEKFFSSLDAKLPLQTRILLNISHWCRTFWWLLLLLVVGLVALGVWLNQSERGRAIRDRVLLKIPVLGDVIRFAVIERFCRTLSAMVAAGVPLANALAVAGEATSNHVYRTGIATAREAMMRGEGLAAPLAETGLFPAAARQMLRVGESTGSLDEQLITTSDYFARELDYKIKKFTGLFEPLVIVAMGVVVAFVAIALISAMYGIFHAVRV
jgi:type IV pilus assembly protein PilC